MTSPGFTRSPTSNLMSTMRPETCEDTVDWCTASTTASADTVSSTSRSSIAPVRSAGAAARGGGVEAPQAPSKQRHRDGGEMPHAGADLTPMRRNAISIGQNPVKPLWKRFRPTKAVSHEPVGVDEERARLHAECQAQQDDELPRRCG